MVPRIPAHCCSRPVASGVRRQIRAEQADYPRQRRGTAAVHADYQDGLWGFGPIWNAPAKRRD